MARLGRAIPLGAVISKFRYLRTVIFDAAANSGYQAAVSTYNFSLTIANQPNRTLIVGVAVLTTGITVTAIDAGGSALTLVRADSSGGSTVRSELWSLMAPPTGSTTITVTLSGSSSSVTTAASYYNADQTALDANDGAAVIGVDPSYSLTTVANFCTVFGQIATTDTAIVTGTGLVQLSNVTGAGGSGAAADKGDITPAGSVTFQWTSIPDLTPTTISLLSIRPPQGIVAWLSRLALLGAG